MDNLRNHAAFVRNPDTGRWYLTLRWSRVEAAKRAWQSGRLDIDALRPGQAAQYLRDNRDELDFDGATINISPLPLRAMEASPDFALSFSRALDFFDTFPEPAPVPVDEHVAKFSGRA
jgi:hypothetical protein